MTKNSSMGSVLIDLLSSSNNTKDRFMAPVMNEIVSSVECAEMFDIIVINALGYKCPICESVIDSAMNFIISKCHHEINSSSDNETIKVVECENCNSFYSQLATEIKHRFASDGLLH